MKWFEKDFRRKERKSKTTKLEPWQYEMVQSNSDVKHTSQHEMTKKNFDVRNPNRRRK